MGNKRIIKRTVLFVSLGLLAFSFISINRTLNNKEIIKEDNFISDKYEEGPMFYAADYTTNYTSETYYNNQYNYTYSCMNTGQTYKRYRGDSVKVAVIDSGLNYDHEDFKNNGTRIIKNVSRSIEYDSGWKYYEFSNNSSHLNDTLGHGSNVASVIASQINSVGCAGLAPNVELYVYKVTNSNNGYDWIAIQNALQYCIDTDIDVINMSFQAYEHEVSYGGSTMGASTGCSSVLTTMINNCYNAGIVMVGAAGNYNTDEPSYPASNNHVISVGSLAESSLTTKAAYSNTYGIDLVAPGTVYVADKGTTSSYKKTQKTSFSAPIVTAAIALYKQKYPTASVSDITNALYNSCDSITGGSSWSGHGRLNLCNFLNEPTSYDNYVTDITLNNVTDGELELEEGDTFDIDYKVNGVGTYSSSVTFELLEDNGTLSIDNNGHIVALKEGQDYISIISDEDDSVTADILVTVTKSSTPSSLSDGLYSILPSDLDTSYPTTEKSYTSTSGVAFKALNVCNQSSKVQFKKNGGYLYNSSPINLYSLTLNNKDGNGTITVYAGNTVNPSSNSISLSNGVYNLSGYNYFKIIDNSSNAVTYTSIDIQVGTPKTLSSITISNYTTSFVEGDSFSFGGTVTAHYSDDSSSDVASQSTFTGYDMEVVGNHTVTVSYSGKTATYTITVNKGTLSSITLSGQTTSYKKGDSFSFSGTCTAHFANGYTKEVTPTSVSSPDMSTGGNKTITVSYTYNGVTKTVSYTITVNDYRVVIEEAYSVIGTITYPSNVETISVNTLSVSTSGYTNKESNAIRLGSGSNTGTVTVTSTSTNISKVVVSAKSYGSDSGVKLSIGGTDNTITSTYVNYTKEFDSKVNSVAIATKANSKRAYVQSITVYTKSSQDIGQSDDCIGLETFINNYLHISDYNENLGYCKDNTHHYYNDAKVAFNNLNSHQRELFSSNSAYALEKARLIAWATANGESLNNDNVLSGNNIKKVIAYSDNSIIVVASILLIISITSIMYFLYRKRYIKSKH